MLDSLPVLALLVVGGAATMIARFDRFVLAGLIVSATALAILLVPYAGWAVAGALLIGNVTSIVMLGLGSAYRAGELENPAELWRKARGFMVRPRVNRQDWRNGAGGYLGWLAIALAAVISLGLSGQPISGTTETPSGTSGFVACWLLAMGLMIILLRRDILKIGGGLVLAFNGAQVMYLSLARNLEALVIMAVVGVMIAVSLGVSYLTAIGATVSVPEESEPISSSVSNSDTGLERQSQQAQGDEQC